MQNNPNNFIGENKSSLFWSPHGKRQHTSAVYLFLNKSGYENTAAFKRLRMLYPCLTLHRIAILIKEFQGCLSCAGCSREVSRPPVPGPALPSVVAPSLILQVPCTVSNPIGAFRPRAGHQTLSSGKAPESPGIASCQSGEEAVLCAPRVCCIHVRALIAGTFPSFSPHTLRNLTQTVTKASLVVS